MPGNQPKRPSTDAQQPAAEALAAERDRLAQALALAERDRLLLGYEVHDGLVQDMTAAAMLLEGTSGQATFGSAEAAENFARGLRLLRDSIAEARRLIRGLATVELDQRGLPSALDRLVQRFQREHQLPLKFVRDADELDLPDSAQHLLLRIAQEALYNVWKHARASRAELRLMKRDRVVELAVEDDGTGFDPGRIPSDRFGLEGMRARARVLGAELTIDSAPGKGTRVSVQLPLGAL
jgi:signal transduction histidine kinase